jgi:hypothetical protein
MKAREACNIVQSIDPAGHVLMYMLTREDVESMMRCQFTDEGWAAFADSYELDHDLEYDEIVYWVDEQVEDNGLDKATMFVKAPASLT